MNIVDIQRYVAKVQKYADEGDDAVAHSVEDELMFIFIQHVAEGHFGELSVLAQEVLKTDSIDFYHWYACGVL